MIARTRIGLKLNHTQMVLNEEILKMRLVEASESVIWMGPWSADVLAWGGGMLRGQSLRIKRLVHVSTRTLGFGFSPCRMLGELLRTTCN